MCHSSQFEETSTAQSDPAPAPTPSPAARPEPDVRLHRLSDEERDVVAQALRDAEVAWTRAAGHLTTLRISGQQNTSPSVVLLIGEQLDLASGTLSGRAEMAQALRARFELGAAFTASDRHASPQSPGVGTSRADRSGEHETPPAERPGTGALDAGLPERELAVHPKPPHNPAELARRVLGCLLDLKGGRVVHGRAVLAALRGEIAACLTWIRQERPAVMVDILEGLEDAEAALGHVISGQLPLHEWDRITADIKLLNARIVPPAEGEPLVQLGQGEYVRKIPGRDAGAYVEVICSTCGAKFACEEKHANGVAAMQCDRCEANGVDL